MLDLDFRNDTPGGNPSGTVFINQGTDYEALVAGEFRARTEYDLFGDAAGRGFIRTKYAASLYRGLRSLVRTLQSIPGHAQVST